MKAAKRYPMGLLLIMVDYNSGTRVKKCFIDVLANVIARVNNLLNGNN